MPLFLVQDLRGTELDRGPAQAAGAVHPGRVLVFGRKGFRAATVKSFYREAGLTERYFYESLANSEMLYAEVYHTLVTQLKNDVVAALDKAARRA